MSENDTIDRLRQERNEQYQRRLEVEEELHLAQEELKRLTSPEVLGETLQDVWNSWTTDTGCFPNCFEWKGGNGTLTAEFVGSRFVDLVSAHLQSQIVVAALGAALKKASMTKEVREAGSAYLKSYLKWGDHVSQVVQSMLPPKSENKSQDVDS